MTGTGKHTDPPQMPRIPPVPDYKAMKKNVAVDSPNFLAYLKLHSKKVWIITILLCAVISTIISEEIIYRVSPQFIAFFLTGKYLVFWYILLYLANVVGIILGRTGFMLFRYMRDQAYL